MSNFGFNEMRFANKVQTSVASKKVQERTKRTRKLCKSAEK